MSYRKSSISQKMLLLNCPFGHLESPFLGLAKVASFMNLHGWSTAVLDLNIILYHYLCDSSHWNNIYIYSEKDKFQENYDLFKPFIDHYVEWIVKSPYRLFGFTVHRFNILFVNTFAERLDQLIDCKIVFGGASLQIEGESRYLYGSKNVSMVLGKAEKVLPCLLRDYREQKLKPKYDASSFSDKVVPFKTTFNEYELGLYLRRCLPVSLNTGCPGHCTFCDERYYFQSPEKGDVNRVCSEIWDYIVTKEVSQFEFTDLAINIFPEALTSLCHKVINMGLDISWNSNAIANRYFDDYRCDLLKKSGCSYLRFGIESGSPTILKKMKKMHNIKEAEKVIRTCRDHNIDVHINIIVGFPGEGIAEFNETVDFIIRNKEYITIVDNIFTCYITPRSELEKYPDQFGIVLPKKEFWYRWYSKDGKNTYEERKKRNDILVNTLNSEGISFGVPDCQKNASLMETNNIPDGHI